MATVRTVPINNGASASMPLAPATLSRRERDVLRGLTDGLSDLQIAHELCLYEAAVKHHVRHLLRKMRMTRTRAAKWWGVNDHEMP